MSCNCTNQVVLPTIAEDQAVTTGVVSSCTPCSEDSECSTGSEGSVVTSAWLDTCCANEEVSLFGRVNDRLTRFTKSGFLKLTNGKASVVSAVPMSLTTLWHKFFKTGPNNRPVLGDPLPFPYLAIGDANANPHGIKGIDDEDSAPYWNSTTKQWEITALSEFPKCQKGLLDRATTGEILILQPIAADGEADAVRCFKTLQGSGILVVNSVATVDSECTCPGCEPSPAFASVVSFLENPETNGTYTLKVTMSGGVATHAWILDT